MAKHPQVAYLSGDQAWPELQRIFGLPDFCTAATIRLRRDSFVTVTCEFGATEDGIAKATKRYILCDAE